MIQHNSGRKIAVKGANQHQKDGSTRLSARSPLNEFCVTTALAVTVRDV